MKTEEIKKRLKDKNINYSMIAEAINVSPSHVRNVAEGIFTSYRVAAAISAALDMPLSEVFPIYKDKSPQAKSKKRKAAISSLRKKIAKTT